MHIQSLKLPVILLTMWTLLFGFFCTGMLHKNEMPMEKMGNTVMISMIDEQRCCGSTMSEHLESWKNTFLVVPQLIRDNLVLLLLASILAFVSIRLPARSTFVDRKLLDCRFYIRDNPDLSLFDHLRIAFARGILNPKITSVF